MSEQDVLAEPSGVGPTLEERQRALARRLLAHEPVAEAAPPAGMSMTAHALRLYAESLFGNCTAVLAAGFPVTRQFLGEDCFEMLARRFIAADPPRSAKLSEYGGGFAAFAACQEELVRLACLHDLMALEWRCKRLLVAADHPDDAAAGDELLKAPCAFVFESRFDVVGLVAWHEGRLGHAPDMAASAVPRHWLLVRRGRRIEMKGCDRSSARLVSAAESHELLDEIERQAAINPQAVRDRLSALIAMAALVQG